MKKIFFIWFLLCFLIADAQQNDSSWWHGIERSVHYQPDGTDFKLVNGNKKFNRALYGGNSAFRVEAGDLPEFALYLPGMGGNLKFGLVAKDCGKWITEASSIETWYRPGSMIYKIEDPILGEGSFVITVMALFDEEALIVKTEALAIPEEIKLVVVFGGATGNKFSRDGDLGADPESSFYLKPEYCKGNLYIIQENRFQLFFGSKKNLSEEERYEILGNIKINNATVSPGMDYKILTGIFPPGSLISIADSRKLESPASVSLQSDISLPVLKAIVDAKNEVSYFLIRNGNVKDSISPAGIANLFDKNEIRRKELCERIRINTPDPYINTLGPAIGIAADAIWESPSFMHGAIAWRMRLNGWRGAYAADVLGWHERARLHFSSYARSQLTSPLSGPVVMDTALNLARHQEKLGNSLFSSGYISRNPNGDFRAHHYDMNLGFIDQLLNHFLWTGDTAYVIECWPLLERHLDWEKRNFDRDGDGLYDAYAAIWASDALQYSGGGVTHSSAYNYRSNKTMAELAILIGKDGSKYQNEAEKILKAIQSKLWIPKLGSYAEYKDLLGNRLLHPAAALWTIYHAIDSRVPDPFQTYQSLRYVETEIPHIPIRAKGLEDTTLYTISTTNWQPYDWSLNNVVLGEQMHTALANWQGGRNEEAFILWKSALIESMYLGGSPGNFHQLSFYDAVRGELYRDFADGIGMTARSLVEGLFGIQPNLLHDSLQISPGFPSSWDHAALETPDLSFSFIRKGEIDNYEFKHQLSHHTSVLLKIRARSDEVASVLVNGEAVQWKLDPSAIGHPLICIQTRPGNHFAISVQWKGEKISDPVFFTEVTEGENLQLTAMQQIISIYDPQSAFKNIIKEKSGWKIQVAKSEGNKTIFLKRRQGKMIWWQPVSFLVKPAIRLTTENFNKQVKFRLSNTGLSKTGILFINHQEITKLRLSKNTDSSILLPSKYFLSGTNQISFEWMGGKENISLVNWDFKNEQAVYEKINLSRFFNEDVKNIFRNSYLTPRPEGPTLQLPVQGIGNWAYPLVTAVINDSGLRKRAGIKNEIVISQGIPFTVSSEPGKNILFVSQWDNYPDSAQLPLTGKARHAYVLMAGSTNPMQSKIVNGTVVIQYRDGSSGILELKNPETWWPIEQDYYEDGYAFITGVKPVRVYLKSGEDRRDFQDFTSIRGFSNRAIDGGAATVLDIPLDPSKELKSITVKSVANDVIIGLMSLTLVR